MEDPTLRSRYAEAVDNGRRTRETKGIKVRTIPKVECEARGMYHSKIFKLKKKNFLIAFSTLLLQFYGQLKDTKLV